MLTPTLFAAESALHEDQRAMTTERVVNMFAEAAPGRQPVTLRSCPGLEHQKFLRRGRVWAMLSAHGYLYASVSGRLIRWDGTSAVDLGGISNARTTMAANLTEVGIVAGENYYVWDGSALTQVSAGAFTSYGSIDYLDGYFILTQEGGQRFSVTGVNDGKTIDALDFSSADRSPDNLRKVLSSNGLLWLFGEETVEAWQNIGAADFPFSRLPNTIIEKGVRTAEEASVLDNTVFWLSPENRVYRNTEFTPTKISTHAVDVSLEGRSAVCFPYQYDGHDFFVVRFTNRPAWVYDAATQSWHERATGAQLGPWEVTATAFHQGRWYAGTIDGNLCMFGGYQDRGQTLRREAISRNVTNGGNRFVVNHVDVRCEAGTGGNAMASFSRDGGRTFSVERQRSLGAVGKYGQRTQWRRLGQSREFAMKLACTDPVDFAIYGAGIELT